MGWLKGKSTGNHRFSHELWDFPVIFPLNQSIHPKIARNLLAFALHIGLPKNRCHRCPKPLLQVVPICLPRLWQGVAMFLGLFLELLGAAGGAAQLQVSGGWFFTYPSEKDWTSSMGMLTFPTKWKNIVHVPVTTNQNRTYIINWFFRIMRSSLHIGYC